MEPSHVVRLKKKIAEASSLFSAIPAYGEGLASFAYLISSTVSSSPWSITLWRSIRFARVNRSQFYKQHAHFFLLLHCHGYVLCRSPRYTEVTFVRLGRKVFRLRVVELARSNKIAPIHCLCNGMYSLRTLRTFDWTSGHNRDCSMGRFVNLWRSEASSALCTGALFVCSYAVVILMRECVART